MFDPSWSQKELTVEEALKSAQAQINTALNLSFNKWIKPGGQNEYI